MNSQCRALVSVVQTNMCVCVCVHIQPSLKISFNRQAGPPSPPAYPPNCPEI